MDKLNLKDFEWKIAVRSLKIDDFPALIELQKLCFPGMQPWTREQIESQLSIFPMARSLLKSMASWSLPLPHSSSNIIMA